MTFLATVQKNLKYKLDNCLSYNARHFSRGRKLFHNLIARCIYLGGRVLKNFGLRKEAGTCGRSFSLIFLSMVNVYNDQFFEGILLAFY